MSVVIETLRDLIRINSVNPAYEGGRPEEGIQQYVTDFFRARGIAATRQEVAVGRPNVIGKVAGRSGRRLVFEAHCDTAGVEGMTIPPFEPEVRDGRVYGRGACDTKAGLAAMMCALADLHASGRQPPCEIWVTSAADEEHAYRGVLKLREGLEAAGGVVAEPTGMRLVVASKGCLRWRIVVRGRAAHSSKPHLGVNAIRGMAQVLVALDSRDASLAKVRHPLVGSPTVNVGRIQGGSQVNIVPESCWVELDRRLVPGENAADVLASYQETIDRVAGLDPSLEVAVEPPFLEDGPLETPVDTAIVQTTAAILQDYGLDPRPCGVAFGSDASKLAQCGIPSIILGPGSIDLAHTAEEYVELDQVERAFTIYRDLMLRFE